MTTDGRLIVGMLPRLVALVVGGRVGTTWVLSGPQCRGETRVSGLSIVGKN